MLEHHFIDYKKSKLHFTKQGEGAEVLLCFHGYGWNCFNFDYVMTDLVERFTVYSFDLFEHGESAWHEKEDFQMEDFEQIFNIFLNTFPVNDFSVMGYSLGGRWALSLVNCYFPRIETLYLIAADGLQRGTIIDVVSGIRSSNKILEYIVHSPLLLGRGIKLGYLLRFYDKERRDFYLEKNDTLEKRKKILKRIRLNKYLLIPRKRLIALLKMENINIQLFYGTRDYVMPVILTSSITRALPKAVLHKIDDDHMLIIKPKFKSALREVLLLSPKISVL